MRLLLVETDGDYVTLVRGLLRRNWEIIVAAGVDEAEARAREGIYDLAIVAASLSGSDGRTAILHLSEAFTAPIIALVDSPNEAEGASALEQGATYDLAKPFSPARLRSAVKAMLSRATSAEPRLLLPEQMDAGGHLVTLVRHEVDVDGRRVVLSPREFALFRTLAANPNRSLSRAELLSLSWGERAGRPSTRQVDVYIGYLRRKLEADPRHPRFIVTERGQGYRWNADERWQRREMANG